METKQQYIYGYISSLVYTIVHDLADITMIQIMKRYVFFGGGLLLTC